MVGGDPVRPHHERSEAIAGGDAVALRTGQGQVVPAMPAFRDRQSRVVDYLVERSFPGAKAVSAGEMSTGATNQHSKDGRDFVLRAQAYRKKLLALSPDDLDKLYADEKMKEAEAAHLAAEEKEANAPYNQALAWPDYEHWAKAAYWTLEEAVWLSLDRDPRRVSVLSFANRASPLLNQFRDRLDLANRAKGVERLYESVLPGFFLSWAREYQLQCPQPLLDAVAVHGGEIVDYKAYYERATAAIASIYAEAEKLGHFQDPSLGLADNIIRLVEWMERLSAERDELRSKVSDRLDTRSRETLLKLIIGMAIGGYAYDPRATRTQATRDIESDLLERGISVSDDTIRKWLREAAELLPRETE